MRSGVLCGREHRVIGRIACIAEGPLALAISRGGARKTYSHRDPNEDCAGFAHGPGGALLVVADGHGGYEASEQAVGELIELGREWIAGPEPSGEWDRRAAEATAQIHTGVVVRGTQGGSPDTRTTLCFALVRPAEGWVAWASVGDSHVFRVDEGGVEELDPSQEMIFLGSPTRTADELGLRCGHAPLAGLRGLVLATDGISERGIGVTQPARAVADALARGAEHEPGLRPLETARDLTETALAAHRRNEAGDNFATAVWLDRSQ